MIQETKNSCLQKCRFMAVLCSLSCVKLNLVINRLATRIFQFLFLVLSVAKNYLPIGIIGLEKQNELIMVC